MSGTTDKIKGNVKETAGAATGNERLEAEGRHDNMAGRIKDVIGDLVDKLRGKGK